MDEPFGALDSLTREQMQELLVSIWKATHTRIFFITTRSRKHCFWARRSW